MTPLLRCLNLTKSFGGNMALRHVDFDLRPGEVHSLAGENGAGKSTLMHLLAGVHQPDSGTIEMGGKTVAIANERQAQDLGLAIVYQERSLFNLRTVAENLFVNHCPVKRFGLIDRNAMHARARELLAQVDLAVDPSAVLGSLTPAQQQMVEIAKALSLSPRIFILDEPTAALTIPETRTLFAIVNRLRSQGAGIIYISHRLEEIFELRGRVSVLKDGVMQGTWNVEETSPEFLVSKMVGREKLDAHRPADAPDGEAAVRLEVRGLNCAKLRDVSFKVRANEVVGLAGLAGAGRTEAALAIFGVRRLESGDVLLDGKVAKIRSPREAIEQGIAYVPEDRKELGLFLNMTIAENIAAAHLELFGQWQFSDSAMDRAAEECMQRFQVAARGPGSIAGTLSGGNQQKVLLARWLLRQPRVLIADEPTRGVDVGAKAEIHRILREIANRGAAVLMISSDLPEILAVSDRIVVMRQGQVAAKLDGRTAGEEQVLRAAAMPEGDAPAA